MKRGLSIASLMVLGSIGPISAATLQDFARQANASGEQVTSEAAVATHQTQGESLPLGDVQGASEEPVEAELEIAPPTRSSLMASWPRIPGATGYLLDVSTDRSFSTYVNEYHELDVGDVTGRVVSGLNQGTTYYYRIRAYDATGRGSYSEVKFDTTTLGNGLTIHATFDSSITNNHNAVAIEAMINRAIAFYELLLTDPITIEIRFRFADTTPHGTPLPQGTLSRSDTVVYDIGLSTFVDVLRADAKTNHDAVANASIGNYFPFPRIYPSSANGRALGLDTPKAMFANGTVGYGGPYDGIVTLNSTVPCKFNRPADASHYDGQRAIEHEIDEVLGLGSHLGHQTIDFRPQDLFSWSSAHTRNISASGTRYFSIDSGVTRIVGFSQNSNGDFGDWLSTSCPQAHPYVQNAFACRGQSSDISATSPEGVNLDVIGYDLINVSGYYIPDTTSRGMVFDFAGQNLYISTSDGLIKVFELSTGSVVRSYHLGGSLNGIDIARDDSFLLAAQHNFGQSQGTFHRVNLTNGAITNIHYTRALSEGGGWDVAVSSNGLALVTTWFQGSGSTPVRQIDLSTNTVTNRTDAPGSGFNGEVSSGTKIERSADGTRLLFIEGDDSSGPVFTYSATTDAFGGVFHTNAFTDGGAVNRNGSLIGLPLYYQPDGRPDSLRGAPNFGLLHSFVGIEGGMAFDAVRNIFYGVNSTTDEIVAYSTATYAELFRVPIGQNVGWGRQQFGPGTLVASADGRWLALQTFSGVRVMQVSNAAPPPPASETVFAPNEPSGATNCCAGTSYQYSTGGSTSNFGHAVQYRFDWGDGQVSDWLPSGITAAAHVWALPGTYSVKTQTRCATHTNVRSGYSNPLSVTVEACRAAVADFNGDGHPDYVLWNPSTRQTAIWYLNNSVHIGSDFGPTLPSTWQLTCVADFNGDAHPDYALINPSTGHTLFGYLSGATVIGAAFAPTLPNGWELAAATDFNADAYPDYVLYKTGTRETAIWYLNDNAYVSGAFGPTLLPGWSLTGVADFNGDGSPDYALFNSSTGQTLIGYLSGTSVIGVAFGPTIPSQWALVAIADFDGDNHPDYLLYKTSTRQTAIAYLDNNLVINAAVGPSLPTGWSLLLQ